MLALAARADKRIVSDDPKVERAIWEAVEAVLRAHGSYFGRDPNLPFPHEISGAWHPGLEGPDACHTFLSEPGDSPRDGQFLSVLDLVECIGNIWKNITISNSCSAAQKKI